MRTSKSVFLVIDDYTPDAGSTIYGVFATQEAADTYVEVGIAEDYGEGHDTSCIDVREYTVQEV